MSPSSTGSGDGFGRLLGEELLAAVAAEAEGLGVTPALFVQAAVWYWLKASHNEQRVMLGEYLTGTLPELEAGEG